MRCFKLSGNLLMNCNNSFQCCRNTGDWWPHTHSAGAHRCLAQVPVATKLCLSESGEVPCANGTLTPAGDPDAPRFILDVVPTVPSQGLPLKNRHAESSGGIKPKIQRSPSYYETWNYIHQFGRKYSPQLRLDPGK